LEERALRRDEEMHAWRVLRARGGCEKGLPGNGLTICGGGVQETATRLVPGRRVRLDGRRAASGHGHWPGGGSVAEAGEYQGEDGKDADTQAKHRSTRVPRQNRSPVLFRSRCDHP